MNPGRGIRDLSHAPFVGTQVLPFFLKGVARSERDSQKHRHLRRPEVLSTPTLDAYNIFYAASFFAVRTSSLR